MTSPLKTLAVSALIASSVAAPAFADDVTHAVLTKISNNLAYPYEAQINGTQGVVTLAVSLDKAGNIASVVVQNSSGEPALDRAAVRAAVNAAPYPTSGSSATTVQGRIRFALSDN